MTKSEAARNEQFIIFPNMRVPEDCVIHRVFADRLDYAEAEENLAWWAASDGTHLADINIHVKARYSWGSVEALITPSD